MTPEQAADKVYAATGVLLGTDKAPHIASYMTVMETRIAELKAALRPFSEMFLYPDDLGLEVAEDIKSDPEWCSDANDLQDENLFVLRGDIRKARAALEGRKKDE